MSKSGYVEIYNQLLFGKILTIPFSSKQEAHSLRAALHTLHSRTQAQSNSVGLDLIQGRITFICTDIKTNTFKVQILLGETRKPRKTFTVLSSEEAGA